MAVDITTNFWPILHVRSLRESQHSKVTCLWGLFSLFLSSVMVGQYATKENRKNVADGATYAYIF